MIAFTRAQLLLVGRSPQQLSFLVLTPLYCLVFFHFLAQNHREHLAASAAVTSFLMALWSHTVFAAAQVIDIDRAQGTLSVLLLRPGRYLAALTVRLLITTALALPALAEIILIGRWVFGLPVGFHRPGLAVAAALLVTAGAAGSALLLSGLMILVRAARTLQNALTYPCYLLAGLILPVASLPTPFHQLSQVFFLSWGAQLLRDAAPGTATGTGGRLAVLALLVAVQCVCGALVARQVLSRIRTGRVILHD